MSAPHQVLQQRRQLLGEGGELDEGRPQVRVVPADEVAAKLVQSLSVVLFVLHVVWGEKTGKSAEKDPTWRRFLLKKKKLRLQLVCFIHIHGGGDMGES